MTVVYEFLVNMARHPLRVRAADRAWRAKERAANTRPPSDKVASRGGRVEVGPKAKPKGKVR